MLAVAELDMETAECPNKMENQMSEQKMHPSVLQHAPKREDFLSREEYEEAVAFFKHRTRHLLKVSQQK